MNPIATLRGQHDLLRRRLSLLGRQFPVLRSEGRFTGSGCVVVRSDQALLGLTREHHRSLREGDVVPGELGVLGCEGATLLGDHLVEEGEGSEVVCHRAVLGGVFDVGVSRRRRIGVAGGSGRRKVCPAGLRVVVRVGGGRHS